MREAGRGEDSESHKQTNRLSCLHCTMAMVASVTMANKTSLLDSSTSVLLLGGGLLKSRGQMVF